MKILHTSDWHLGKKLYKKDRLPEQILFLNWLREQIQTTGVEILVIAGDIFDTALPPTNAIRAFYHFLNNCHQDKINKKSHLKSILAIGGNHDNGKLLEAPEPFLEETFFRIVGSFENEETNFNRYYYHDEDSAIKFLLLPFFRTREIVNLPWYQKEEDGIALNTEKLLSALSTWIEKVLQSGPNAKKNILIAHHLFGDFIEAGSEQGVTLSGLNSLPLSLFKDFDLLCLGHIHKPQKISSDPLAFYTGSPYPLRFSESNEKFINLYDLSHNPLITEKIKVPAFRPLIKLSCALEDYKECLKEDISSYFEDMILPCFLEVHLKTTLSPSEGIAEIISIHKELELEDKCDILSFFTTNALLEEAEEKTNIEELQTKTIAELFDVFLEKNTELEENQKQELTITFKKLQTMINEKNGEILQ